VSVETAAIIRTAAIARALRFWYLLMSRFCSAGVRGSIELKYHSRRQNALGDNLRRMAEYESPVIIERVRKRIGDDPDLCEMAEVRLAKTGEILAQTMMCDDIGLEGIADALSAKGLRREADAFRRMMMDSRGRAA
jgi:hypothetical protein